MLTNCLLVAHPRLRGFFEEAVVLVLDETDGHYFGVMLNRPLMLSGRDLLGDMPGLSNPHAPALLGGPVHHHVLILSEFTDPDEHRRFLLAPRGTGSRRGPAVAPVRLRQGRAGDATARADGRARRMPRAQPGVPGLGRLANGPAGGGAAPSIWQVRAEDVFCPEPDRLYEQVLQRWWDFSRLAG